ncbi:hypothetical protein BDC45DRAFT_333704 [Circinella umbellata]|nr:hypothetical protein BDC45DRAFT_333704 [Circinella umbellata]
MARFFNEDHEKVFVLAPQIDDDEENFLVRYNSELIEIFSSYNDKQQEQSLEIAAYSNLTTSTDHNSQSAGLNEYYYKGVRRIIAGHIQFHSEAQGKSLRESELYIYFLLLFFVRQLMISSFRSFILIVLFFIFFSPAINNFMVHAVPKKSLYCYTTIYKMISFYQLNAHMHFLMTHPSS